MLGRAPLNRHGATFWLQTPIVTDGLRPAEPTSLKPTRSVASGSDYWLWRQGEFGVPTLSTRGMVSPDRPAFRANLDSASSECLSTASTAVPSPATRHLLTHISRTLSSPPDS